jgi:biopolymer transport protein ExbD
MKLQSTLKLRPDFLFVAPLLNVVLLLLIFFLVTSSLVVQGGVRVELPISASTLRSMDHAHVLTVTAQRAPTAAPVKPAPAVTKEATSALEAAVVPPENSEPMLYLNREKITLAALPQRLKDPAITNVSRQVIINADVLVSHGRVIELQDIIYAAGCQPAIATSQAP